MTELEQSAERLLKWNKRRSFVNKVLNYDLRRPSKTEETTGPRPFATGEPRAIPALIVAFRIWRANDRFCEAASACLGVDVVKNEEEIPPHLRRSGSSFEDPLVRFPNGLVLDTVDAAEHVLYVEH